MQKLAGADHTTLLLNCYTKLKDVSKLDAFLRGSGATDGSTPPPFDAETAVKVSGMRVSSPRASHCDRCLPCSARKLFLRCQRARQMIRDCPV